MALGDPSGTEPLEVVARLENEANELAEAGCFRKACELFTRASAIAPDRAQLHEAQAQVLMELDEPDAALAAAKRAVELRPDWDVACATLGRTLLNCGHLQDAIESFARALSFCCVDVSGQQSEARTDLEVELAEARALLERHWQEHHDFVLQLRPSSEKVASSEERFTHLRIRQSLDCRYCRLLGEQGPGGAVWAAGVVLARFLLNRSSGDAGTVRWRGCSALELGSGTGIGGLAVAAMGARVLLTDREPCVPLLSLNADLNSATVHAAGGHVACIAFDWLSDPPPEVAQQSWDVVLAADLVYSFASVLPFANAVAAVTGCASNALNSSGVGASVGGTAAAAPVIYAHNPRSPDLDSEMQRALVARGLCTKKLPPPPLEQVGHIGLQALQRVVLMEITPTCEAAAVS